MTKEQVNDREYTRVIETLETIASEEVLDLVLQLEVILEIKHLSQEINDYRRVKEGE